MVKLGRLLTAMVTPFDSEGRVDYEQAKRLSLALLDSGSDGLVVSGTTGERSTLTDKEQIRLFEAVKEAVGGGGTVVAGTGSNCTRECLEMTREAERIGVDAVLLVVPYYNKPPQEGLFEHFKTIAQGTSLPCILYNVPSRTVTNIAPDIVIRLSEIDNIMGIKEASGNLDQIAKIIDGTSKDFLVYSGNDSDTFYVVAMGGYGVISVASHLVGNQMQEMIEKLVSDKMSEAAAIHHYLLPLINALFVVSNPIPIKYALNHVGFRVGKPRLPLTEPDERSAAQIEAALKNYHIDLPLAPKP
jgi:4-hydroxy-tetrahydrodipicolinate synthase